MPIHNQYTITPALVEEFLYVALNGKGFSIDIDDYVVAAQILRGVDDVKESLGEIKVALAAVICRNAEEQRHFYTLFDSFFSENEAFFLRKQKLEQEGQYKKKKRFVYCGISATLIAIFLFLTFAPVFKPESLTIDDFKLDSISDHHAVGMPLKISVADDFLKDKQFAARQTFIEKLFKPKFDSTGLKTTWNLQDTTFNNRNLVEYRFAKPGTKKIEVWFSIPNVRKKIEKSSSLLICDSLPEISFSGKDFVNKGDTVTLKAGNNQNKSVKWTIDGRDTITRNNILRYHFDSVKTYLIGGKYLNQICPHNVNQKNIDVKDLDKFSIINTQTGKLKASTFKELTSFFYILFWIIGILFLCVSLCYFTPFLYRIYENAQLKLYEKIFPNKQAEYLQATELPTFLGTKMPVDIQFFNKDIFISGKDAIVKLAFDLRKKIESEVFVLNLRKTSKATIQNFGLFSPVLQNKNIQRSYLVIIDKSYVSSPQVKLFQYLVSLLLGSQVELNVYYYIKSPLNLFQKQAHNTVSINYLKNRHYQSVLIVFGDGYNFLDDQFAEVYIPFRNEFSYWSSRLLITPIAAADWSLNEKILASFFNVLPADNIGLINAFEVLLNEVYNQKIIGTSLYQTYSSKFIEFEEIEELRAYVNDEQIFQWIAAIAVYPKINWEVIVAIGNRLDNGLVTYQNLLKMCRIDWVRQGAFPTKIRLELLKKLTLENEIKTREALIRLLEEDSENDQESFANNEKIMQLIVNKFVLYSNNPLKYPAYRKEEKEFLKFYQNGKIGDIPLKIYLQGVHPKNNTENWDNPLSTDSDNGDKLLHYYNNKVVLPKADNVKRKIRNSLLIPLILLGVLLFLGVLIGFTKPNLPQLVKTEVVTGNASNWKVLLNKNVCYLKFSPSRLILSKNGTVLLDTAVSVDTSKTKVDTLNLTGFEKVEGEKLEFRLISEKKGTISESFQIDSLQSHLQIFRSDCVPNDPPNHQVYLRYYPERLKDSMKIFQDKLIKEGYNVAPDLDREQTNLSVVRYSAGYDANRADMVAIQAGVFFRKDIKAEKVNATLNNQIEVWIKGTVDTVQIQYNAADQKAIADKLKKDLEAVGYYVQQNVMGAFDWNNEVRYYRRDNKDKATAILKIVRNSTLGSMKINQLQLSLPEKNNNIIKVWLKDLTLPQNSCKSVKTSSSYTFYFDRDKSNIRAEDQKMIDDLLKLLRDNPDNEVKITAYVSSGNTEAYRLQLAKALSNSFINYIIKNGINASRLKAAGMEVPLSGNNCGNRIEIKINKNSICKSVGLGDSYIIYFEKGMPTLSTEAVQLLKELASKLDKNPNIKITVNSYSRGLGMKMSEQYGNAIKSHLSNKMVNKESGLYKSYRDDPSDKTNDCGEKSIIIVQDFSDTKN
ncbi:OmpA family protein [Pedobacter vanadiisoli]|uniref:OmpA family protein n=1 Tax=Pedobacter vanadiisoli TaxID=1761975 RepID=A0ABW5MK70_9SPHI